MAEPHHDVPEPPPATLEKKNGGSAAAVLEESEVRFRRLFENASDGILLYDDRGVIFDANPKILRMLDYTLDDLLGRKITDMVHPADLETLAATGHLEDGQGLTIPNRLQRRDGRYISVEQYVIPVSADMRLCLLRDNAIREQAEQKLLDTIRDAEDSEMQLEEALSRVNTMAIEAEVAAMQMDQVFNATSDGICVVNKDFQVSKINRVLEEIMASLGLPTTRQRCDRLFSHQLCGTGRCLLERILKEGRVCIEEEIVMTSRDGRRHTFLVTARPLMDLTDEIIGIVESYRDITERKQIEQELRRMAVTDPLTGAFNRRLFMRRAQEEMDRSRRYQTSLTLLMLDIDHFKRVNDTFGHDAGDTVLKGLVAESMHQLRGSDVFCRLGGEEFAAILTHTSLEQGRLAAERLRQALNALEFETALGAVRFTVSIGLASMVTDGLSLAQIMKKADKALYEAKQRGRDRVVAFE